jgi:hypothetical protein
MFEGKRQDSPRVLPSLRGSRALFALTPRLTPSATDLPPLGSSKRQRAFTQPNTDFFPIETTNLRKTLPKLARHVSCQTPLVS